MGNNNDIRLVLGSLRYKSAPNTDFSIKLPLTQNVKQNVEFDRASDINLQQVYDDERQSSTIFRPVSKFSVIFKNSYAGETNYEPFENNLYYLNATESAILQCSLGSNAVSWSGLPQYNEFNFIRTDYNASGYTQPPNNHLLFIPQSASTYNWNFHLSYPYENDSTKILEAVEKNTIQTLSWTAGDGIPFVVELTQFNGQNLVSFRCPVKHGLNVSEFAKLSFDYNGQDLFQVDSLGLDTYNSDEYVFNIINVGYTGTTFYNGRTGTFKRIILDSNSGDTTSKYYVRKHKILTDVEDSVLVKAGFEENIFGTKKKYESSGYTPNRLSRVSVKEGAQSFTLSFNKDVDLGGLLDNLGRPITELFFTVIWKGYFGWTTGKLKQGYEFNLPLNPITEQPTQWWDDNTIPSNTTLTTSTWTNVSGDTFSYVTPLKPDDVLDGDLCEWNDFEQKERVISQLYHKFKFNPFYFNIAGGTPTTNPFGYYYQPHHSLKIRQYSDYIETADSANIVDLPNYAYFSTTLSQFIWRDLYSYGFIDSNGLGVDYPFLNAGHYPFKNTIFRIIPEGTNYIEQTIIEQPLTDECE